MVHERNTPSRPRGPHGPRDHRPHHRDHLGKRLQPILRVRKSCGDTRRRSLRLRLRAQQGAAKHGQNNKGGKGGPFDILHMRRVHNVTRFGRVDRVETVVPMRLRHPDEDKPLRALRAAVRAFRKDHHLAPVFVHQVDHVDPREQALLRIRVGCTLARPRRDPVTQELLVDLVPHCLVPRIRPRHTLRMLRLLPNAPRRSWLPNHPTVRPDTKLRVFEALPVSATGATKHSDDDVDDDGDSGDDDSGDDDSGDDDGALSCGARSWAGSCVDNHRKTLAAMSTIRPITLKVVPAGACPRVVDADADVHTLPHKVGLLVVDDGHDHDHDHDHDREAAMASIGLTAPAARRPWRLLRAYLHTKVIQAERNTLAAVAHFHRPLRPLFLLRAPAPAPAAPSGAEVHYYLPQGPQISFTSSAWPHAYA